MRIPHFRFLHVIDYAPTTSRTRSSTTGILRVIHYTIGTDFYYYSEMKRIWQCPFKKGTSESRPIHSFKYLNLLDYGGIKLSYRTVEFGGSRLQRVRSSALCRSRIRSVH